MKFSIVTITYNAAAYLEQTLSSVADQEYTDFEHILWDGGSTDQTLEIARGFPHLKIYEGKDEGISDAMNRGAAFAKGEFLLHLHADDLLAHPRTLSMVASTLKLHPDIEWLYGQAAIINSCGDWLQTTPYESYSFKRLRKYNFITHPATYVKRSLFEKVGGFHKALRYCMDYDLWLRLATHQTGFPLPTVLAHFRSHQDSLSTSEPIRVADEAYRVRNRYVTTLYERFRSYRTWKKRRQKFLGVE